MSNLDNLETEIDRITQIIKKNHELKPYHIQYTNLNISNNDELEIIKTQINELKKFTNKLQKINKEELKNKKKLKIEEELKDLLY